MKKEKIGIITFHNSYNCGSMLQTYALHTVLNEKSINNEVVDFSNDGQKELYSVFSKKINLKNLIKNCITFFHKKQIENNYSSYEKFKNKNFILSSKKFSKCEQLSDKDYTTVITGSDQVWNITIADGDDAYFLPWVKNARKIAYAPSFGAKNIMKNSEEPNRYKDYLLDFDAISIRENNGKKWIKDLCDIDVDVLLDPTLLLNREDYEPICDKEVKTPKEYIFYYSPGYNKSINKLVEKISKKYNLPVIAFNAKNFYVKGLNIRSTFKLPKIENPSVYLKLIKNATLVITTSFHGTIFSTIYRKKFWTIKNGGMFGDDDRVLTLANTLDLNDRIIPIEFDENFDYLKEKDYTKYELLLEENREKSMKFIDTYIVNGGSKK